MKTKINKIEFTFSAVTHEGKFSQSKKRKVGMGVDLTARYKFNDEPQMASVSWMLDVTDPEKPSDVARRLVERVRESGVKVVIKDWEGAMKGLESILQKAEPNLLAGAK